MPEDYALAVALDRMYGPALWLPEEWVNDDGKRSTITSALLDLDGVVGHAARGPLLVSTSLNQQALQAVIDRHEPESLGVGLGRSPGDGDAPTVGDAALLELGDPVHLACAGDYDNVLTLPSRHDGVGGIDLLVPTPATTPKEPSLQGPRRPFWEVDVEPLTGRIPQGGVPGSVFLAAERNPRSCRGCAAATRVSRSTRWTWDSSLRGRPYCNRSRLPFCSFPDCKIGWLLPFAPGSPTSQFAYPRPDAGRRSQHGCGAAGRPLLVTCSS